MSDPVAVIEEFYARLDDYVLAVIEQGSGDGITRAELCRLLPTMIEATPGDITLDFALARLREDGRIGMDKERRPRSDGALGVQWVIRA